MDVGFARSDLALVETDRAADTGLPVGVIYAARQRIVLLRAAPDFSMLTRWKSFGYSGAPDGSAGEHPILVFEEWRMWVRIDPNATPPKAIVTKISQQIRGAA